MISPPGASVSNEAMTIVRWRSEVVRVHSWLAAAAAAHGTRSHTHVRPSTCEPPCATGFTRRVDARDRTCVCVCALRSRSRSVFIFFYSSFRRGPTFQPLATQQNMYQSCVRACNVWLTVHVGRRTSNVRRSGTAGAEGTMQL